MDEFRPDPSWLHWLPFAALMAKETPPNRPMTTRIVEQVFIGVIAGAGGAYLTIQITLAVQDNKITTLQQQVQENRESARQDIRELRERLYRKDQ
ncbi:hypothetical protein [Sulfuriferula sp.]|uniref:hypothetical protein n=1 Tax=Sulfuriferula sp. TaxID=2025307 RepID=UPI00272FCD51|nr:hypothetical protein [Sulfuriferula sp.]MDP2026460.1 hypothetical protein [Sulfuriferula sp.]